jgi:hypothetical protein
MLEQLPSSIGGLSVFQHLNLTKCVRLMKLCNVIDKLNAFRQLDLIECGMLKQLPLSISRLGTLPTL